MANDNDIPAEYQFNIFQQVSGSDWGTRSSSEGNVVFTAWLPEEFNYSMSSNYEAPFQPLLQNSWVGVAQKLMGANLMTPLMTAQLWSGSETPEFSVQVQLEAESSTAQDVKAKFLRLLQLVTPYTNSYGMMLSPGPRVDVKKVLERAAASSSTISSGFDTINSALNLVMDDNHQNLLPTSGSGVKTQNGGRMIDSSESVMSEKSDVFSTASYISGPDALVSNQISISIGRYLYFPSVVITNVNSTLLHCIDGTTGWPMSATIDISFRPLFMPVVNDYKNMFEM